MRRAKVEAQIELFPPEAVWTDPDRLDFPTMTCYWTLAGRCSGLPECCIAWFVELHRMEERGEREAADAYRIKIPRGMGYIPCPQCLASQAFVLVRDCPTSLVSVGCACRVVKEQLFLVRPTQRVAMLVLCESEILRCADNA